MSADEYAALDAITIPPPPTAPIMDDDEANMYTIMEPFMKKMCEKYIRRSCCKYNEFKQTYHDKSAWYIASNTAASNILHDGASTLFSFIISIFLFVITQLYIPKGVYAAFAVAFGTLGISIPLIRFGFIMYVFHKNITEARHDLATPLSPEQIDELCSHYTYFRMTNANHLLFMSMNPMDVMCK